MVIIKTEIIQTDRSGARIPLFLNEFDKINPVASPASPDNTATIPNVINSDSSSHLNSSQTVSFLKIDEITAIWGNQKLRPPTLKVLQKNPMTTRI